MDRSKIVAIVTGAIALLLGIAYLIVVQFLDFRGEMLPAPISQSAVIVMAQILESAIDLG
ncbi:hypothetical protein H6F67_10250 [Microcoleus sp. FACHB-1515]|uniref:hypothetical protein n=1 Tax=Cyanophyceae TaxID=3028117 RepID=UPI0016865C11|nr:hypothetical protein [Microcoleus sp. FACHB-1515]MBD2090233.1 hypothetical protein [Microcoleus sp. FACHB-1515]